MGPVEKRTSRLQTSHLVTTKLSREVCSACEGECHTIAVTAAWGGPEERPAVLLFREHVAELSDVVGLMLAWFGPTHRELLERERRAWELEHQVRLW